MPSEEKANKLLQLGIELAKAGEMDEALKLFGEALDIVPGNPVVNYNCGLAQQQAGSIEAAVIAYRAAIEVLPEFTEARINLSCALKLYWRFSEALEAAERAIQLEAQVNRTSAAKDNIANANTFSLSQDGFLQNVQTALERMSELSLVAQDATKSDTDRSNYAVEFSQLQNYISDIGTKKYNGTTLFASSGQVVTIDSDAALCFCVNTVSLDKT